MEINPPTHHEAPGFASRDLITTRSFYSVVSSPIYTLQRNAKRQGTTPVGRSVKRSGPAPSFEQFDSRSRDQVRKSQLPKIHAVARKVLMRRGREKRCYEKHMLSGSRAITEDSRQTVCVTSTCAGTVWTRNWRTGGEEPWAKQTPRDHWQGLRDMR